jgi:hypothetical protein
MKLAVIIATALATLAVADSASARGKQIGVGKGSIAVPKKVVRPSTTTKGIIMRDGGICNPRWGC